MPSVQTNDALAFGLRITLNSTAAVQPAAQLEARLGRSALQNALFPQGADSICSFLQDHNPESQVTCSLWEPEHSHLLPAALCNQDGPYSPGVKVDATFPVWCTQGSATHSSYGW